MEREKGKGISQERLGSLTFCQLCFEELVMLGNEGCAVSQQGVVW